MQKLFDVHKKIIVDFDYNLPYEQLKGLITSKYVGDALEDMMNALMDDFNITQVLAIMNQSLNSLDKIEEVDRNDLFVALHRLEKNLLKVWLFDRIGKKEKEIKIPAKITKLADQRLEAKQAKDYAKSDELRKQIADLWREVKDTKEGYELSKI